MVPTPTPATAVHQNMAMASTDTAEEFSALLREHRKIVYKVAASYAWNEADRADLAQEISTQLWSAFARYDRARPFTTWMYRVALNTGMAHARAESAKARHFTSDAASQVDTDTATATAGSVEETEAMVLLSQAMARLDRADRALLLLHLEARSSGEIGDILGLTATNVTTRISRIRQRLSATVS